MLTQGGGSVLIEGGRDHEVEVPLQQGAFVREVLKQLLMRPGKRFPDAFLSSGRSAGEMRDIRGQVEWQDAHQNLEWKGESIEQGAILGDDGVLLLRTLEAVVDSLDLQHGDIVPPGWRPIRCQTEDLVM